MTPLHPGLAVFALLLAACSPTLDWRDSRPEGSGARLTFPCKPASRAREVLLADKRLPMRLHSCDAGDATFALTVVDLPDPSSAPAVVAALKQAAMGNIDATSLSAAAFTAKGMTPSPAAERVVADGKLPDGSAVRQEAAFFTAPSRAYQATILSKPGKRLAPDAADTFFDSIELAR